MKKRLASLSLTWRLTLLFTCAMLFFLLILNVFVYWATMQLVYRHEHQLLQAKADVMANEVANELANAQNFNDAHIHRIFRKFTNEYQAVFLFDAEGRNVMAVKGTKWKEESVQDQERIFTPHSYFITQKSALQDIREISVPSVPSPLKIKIVEDAEPLNHFIRILLLILGTASAGAVLISGVGGYFFSRLGLVPLNRLVNDIYKMEAAHLSSRLSVQSTAEEISALTDAFNGLLERIEAVISKQKQFVADASHELRTPLTIIDGYIRLLDRWGKDQTEVREEAIQAMKQESQRLFHLIDDLLTLAKLEDSHVSMESLDIQELSPLLEEVKQAWTSVFPAQLQFVCEWEPHLTLPMDREKIRRLLDIVLDNARKYTDEGEVYLRAYKEGDFIHIAIEDTGIGIKEDEIPFVFERFYRVDKSRSRQLGGSGLGLAIAKSIVDIHGGYIRIERTAKGGTGVHILLPGS
jgi:two-component system sensor histidine kinase ArlS